LDRGPWGSGPLFDGCVIRSDRLTRISGRRHDRSSYVAKGPSSQPSHRPERQCGVYRGLTAPTERRRERSGAPPTPVSSARDPVHKRRMDQPRRIYRRWPARRVERESVCRRGQRQCRSRHSRLHSSRRASAVDNPYDLLCRPLQPAVMRPRGYRRVA